MKGAPISADRRGRSGRPESLFMVLRHLSGVPGPLSERRGRGGNHDRFALQGIPGRSEGVFFLPRGKSPKQALVQAGKAGARSKKVLTSRGD